MKHLFNDYMENIDRDLHLIDPDSLEKIIHAILNCREKGKSIFTMGNGGSGATASHWVCDLNKGAISEGARRIRASCLNDNLPTLMAYANDMSYDDIFVEPLKNFLNKGDLVIGFSGSGNSKNVLKAIAFANEAGAETIGFTGFDGGELAKITRLNLNVPADDIKIVEDVHQILCHIILYAIKDLSHG